MENNLQNCVDCNTDCDTVMHMKRTSTECCKYCGEPVSLHDSGVTYRNGECAHEECDDAEQFRRENAADLDEEHGNR